MTESLLRWTAIFGLFFVFLFLYTKLAGPVPFSVNSVTTTKSDTFNVTGEGTSTVKPDVAVVSAGIQARGNTVKEAQDQINNVINKVSEAIKKVGVDPKDIKTTNYNINPEYDFRSGTQRITGYSANTNLEIKIRDISKVNQVIDEATVNGANQVGGVTFDVDDKSKAEGEARKEAVDEAKKKAQQAAQIAGFSLGRLVNYTESFQGDAIPPTLRMDVSQGALEQKATQVEPGSNEVRVVVTLSYEIR